MATTPTERALQEIVAKTLEIDPDGVELGHALLEDMGLDSFSIMTLMLEIETAFPPVSLSDKSFEELRTLRDVADYIDQTLGGK